jgi:hypothetical protein
MSRLTDLFQVPTRVDINQTGDQLRPYQSSCPQGDHQGRPATTMREAREQQARHYAEAHYGFDADAWTGDQDRDRDDPGGGRGLFW